MLHCVRMDRPMHVALHIWLVLPLLLAMALHSTQGERRRGGHHPHQRSLALDLMCENFPIRELLSIHIYGTFDAAPSPAHSQSAVFFISSRIMLRASYTRQQLLIPNCVYLLFFLDSSVGCSFIRNSNWKPWRNPKAIVEQKWNQTKGAMAKEPQRVEWGRTRANARLFVWTVRVAKCVRERGRGKERTHEHAFWIMSGCQTVLFSFPLQCEHCIQSFSNHSHCTRLNALKTKTTTDRQCIGIASNDLRSSAPSIPLRCRTKYANISYCIYDIR